MPSSSSSSSSALFSLNREDFSNQRILRITLSCFLVFSLMEGAAGIASGSLSLLGDAAAMLVDSFAYFMNLFAEKLKSGDGNLTCILGALALHVDCCLLIELPAARSCSLCRGR